MPVAAQTGSGYWFDWSSAGGTRKVGWCHAKQADRVRNRQEEEKRGQSFDVGLEQATERYLRISAFHGKRANVPPTPSAPSFEKES
ncbi:hypothetical protein PoB_000825900 [Plakobranchus ocellatus]|uniref:Uncharacterized protein n=1 Tax=Plakobranchus ocellatus TaxID=259542 RepID=A0AAV3YHJ1_9GAST|nr:hypothetical protein PoB_000825900 [Plakobranchus ocellatus]